MSRALGISITERSESISDAHDELALDADSLLFVVGAMPRGSASSASCPGGRRASTDQPIVRCRPTTVNFNFIVEPVWNGVPHSALAMLAPVGLALAATCVLVPLYVAALDDGAAAADAAGSLDASERSSLQAHRPNGEKKLMQTGDAEDAVHEAGTSDAGDSRECVNEAGRRLRLRPLSNSGRAPSRPRSARAHL